MIETLIGELYFDVELYDSIELATRIRIGEHYNGSKCIIWKDGNVLIGQLEASIAFQGSLVQLNNASTTPYISYLNNELVGRQLVVSGSIIYTNQAAYHAMRADAMSGRKSNYRVEYADGEEFTATFTPTNLADSFPRGNAAKSSFSLRSSGAVTRITVE